MWFARQKERKTACQTPEQSQRLLARGPMTRNPAQHSHRTPDPRPPAQPHLQVLLQLQPGLHQVVLKLLSLLLPLLLQGVEWPQLDVTGSPRLGVLARLTIGDDSQRVARGAVAGVRPTFPVVVGQHVVHLPLVVMEVHAAHAGLRGHRLTGLQVVVDDLAGEKGRQSGDI